MFLYFFFTLSDAQAGRQASRQAGRPGRPGRQAGRHSGKAGMQACREGRKAGRQAGRQGRQAGRPARMYGPRSRCWQNTHAQWSQNADQIRMVEAQNFTYHTHKQPPSTCFVPPPPKDAQRHQSTASTFRLTHSFNHGDELLAP